MVADKGKDSDFNVASKQNFLTGGGRGLEKSCDWLMAVIGGTGFSHDKNVCHWLF
jgi:hypothetical protein